MFEEFYFFIHFKLFFYLKNDIIQNKSNETFFPLMIQNDLFARIFRHIIVEILKQRSSYFNLIYLGLPLYTQHPLYRYFHYEGINHMLTFIHSLSNREVNCIVSLDYNLQYFRMM